MFVIIIKWSSNYNYKNFRWQPRQEADSQLSITYRLSEVLPDLVSKFFPRIEATLNSELKKFANRAGGQNLEKMGKMLGILA
jgi:hypothetical protein